MFLWIHSEIIYLPKNTSNGHQEPEVGAGKVLEVEHGVNLTKDDHEGQEEDASIDIVVEGEGPDVSINNWENLLCVDREERNKQRSQYSIYGARERKASRSIFLINAKIETSNNSSTATNGTQWCFLAKDEVSHQNIEDRSQTPSNVIEGDTNILKTEIVEGDHANKDNGEREDLNIER